MNESTEEAKKYMIQSHEFDFFVGTSNADEQVLLGIFWPQLIAVFFNAAGTLLRYEMRDPSVAWTTLQEDDIDARLEDELEEWKRDLELRSCPIRVCKFFIENRAFDIRIGIRDMPEHLEDFLQDPSFVEDEAERRDWYESVARWRAQESHVLFWGKEYWMNRHGEVTDT
jgi:hypothetical protein